MNLGEFLDYSGRDLDGLVRNVDLRLYIFLDKFSGEPCGVFCADDKGFLWVLLEDLLKFSRKVLAMVFEEVMKFDLYSESLNILAESFGVSEAAYNAC